MRTHPDIGLIGTRQQTCSRLAATCAFLAVYKFSFVKTPRKFIITRLSIRKLGSSSDVQFLNFFGTCDTISTEQHYSILTLYCG